MAAASTDTIEASGTTATLEDVQALLASFDVNKDGKLSREELQLCCAGLGIYLDDEDAAAVRCCATSAIFVQHAGSWTMTGAGNGGHRQGSFRNGRCS